LTDVKRNYRGHTGPHDNAPVVPAGRHAPNPQRGPEQILKLAKADPWSRTLATAAKCCVCKRTAVAIRACADRACPLHFLRPFQITEPKSAPHVEYRDPFEVPDGLTPGEPEASD
jgi:hypothetical protein